MTVGRGPSAVLLAEVGAEEVGEVAEAGAEAEAGAVGLVAPQITLSSACLFVNTCSHY